MRHKLLGLLASTVCPFRVSVTVSLLYPLLWTLPQSYYNLMSSIITHRSFSLFLVAVNVFLVVHLGRMWFSFYLRWTNTYLFPRFSFLYLQISWQLPVFIDILPPLPFFPFLLHRRCENSHKYGLLLSDRTLWYTSGNLQWRLFDDLHDRALVRVTYV